MHGNRGSLPYPTRKKKGTKLKTKSQTTKQKSSCTACPHRQPQCVVFPPITFTYTSHGTTKTTRVIAVVFVVEGDTAKVTRKKERDMDGPLALQILHTSSPEALGFLPTLFFFLFRVLASTVYHGTATCTDTRTTAANKSYTCAS